MLFNELFPANINGSPIDRHSTEALAHIPYKTELELKNCAVRQLLQNGQISIVPNEVVPSPLPRKYRTTTKRRVFFNGRKVFLHFGKKPNPGINIADSALEPDEHLKIYTFLQKFFSTPANFKASSALNYLIIRGSYSERILIFNTKRLSGDIIRILKNAVNKLIDFDNALRGAFIYVDESGSDYYLEVERPAKGVNFKKLYGTDFLALKLNGRKFLYSPLSFSQINESILPLFFDEFKKYLTPAANDILMDMYCGYGLWSLTAGDMFKNAWGVELAPLSVKSAQSNAKFHFPGKNFRYECGFVTSEYLRKTMPPTRKENEWILLDPPRQGCAAGVLEYLISRKPGKIFHLFCGADEIVPALKIYLANNCKIEALIPFDFFPGTLNIEMLAVISCG